MNRVFSGFWALFVVLLALAWAHGTPAGTEIRNQASASYIDSSGLPQTTTSNEVITVVQPVYGLDIQPDGSDENNPGQVKHMLPAGTVYFNWTVKNTGNTTDTFSLSYTQGNSNQFDFDVRGLYHDANCNGQIDPGESTVTSVTLAADESTCIIMEAKADPIPSNNQYANINLEGESAHDQSVNDTNNWARAIATEDAILDASKSASPGSDVAPGDTITYTVRGANIGGSAAYAVAVSGVTDTGILVEDAVPEHTKVTAMPTGVAGAGTGILYVKSVDGGQSWSLLQQGDLPIAGDAQGNHRIGMLIKGAGDFFTRGAQYEFRFSVTVDAGVAAGVDIANTASVKYDNDGNSSNGSQTAHTNTTHNRVAPSYSVANGPNGDPDADGSGFDGSYTDPTGTTWHYAETTGDPDDAEKITDPVYGGDTVYFKNTLQNTGNSSDSYDLSISGVPTGWTCQVMAADGTTPLANPVGPVAAGTTLDYVVRCSIPATFTSQADTRLTVTATSVNDPNDPPASNATHDVVPPVSSGYAVDIAKDRASGDNNANNDNPDGQTVDPGVTAYYGFEVANTGQNPDTYNLSAAVTGIPGATTTIYPDPDCDGVLDNPAPAPVTDTGLIEAGKKECFVLAVDVPDGTAPSVQNFQDPNDDNVTITATSNADPSVSDEVSADLEVNLKAEITFTPDRNGTVTSPGTIVYTHTLTNNGNADASVSFSGSGSTHPTWTYQISTNGGASWTSVGGAAVNLAKGDSKEIQIRVIVPDGEPIGAVDAVQITASASYSANGINANDSASVTDTTTVVGGDLRLEKQVDKTAAKPGENLTYTITATNIGTADLKQVIISDPLPGYTSFVSVSASTDISGGTVVYSTDGSAWSTSAPTSLSVGGAIYVAVDTTGPDTNGDYQITADDVMPPGASITITFVVRVQ